MSSTSPEGDPSAERRVMKVYVLQKDAPETPERVEALQRIATENQADVEANEGEDQKIRVVVRGAMSKVINTSAAVQNQMGKLDGVTVSVLMGDYEKRPTGTKD